VHQAPRPLVRREIRDDNLPPVAAALASKPIADLAYWAIVAESCPQLDQGKPRMVSALSTVRAIVVVLVDVSETGRFKFGVFRRDTVPASGSAYPPDNSYSIRPTRALYDGERSISDADDRSQLPVGCPKAISPAPN